jgi:putative ABC transport system substrate-binding protein
MTAGATAWMPVPDAMLGSRTLGLEVTAINIRDRAEMEQAVSAFAGLPNGGLVVTAGPLSTLHII